MNNQRHVMSSHNLSIYRTYTIFVCSLQYFLRNFKIGSKRKTINYKNKNNFWEYLTDNNFYVNTYLLHSLANCRFLTTHSFKSQVFNNQNAFLLSIDHSALIAVDHLPLLSS
jgi:hypothetical protein